MDFEKEIRSPKKRHRTKHALLLLSLVLLVNGCGATQKIQEEELIATENESPVFQLTPKDITVPTAMIAIHMEPGNNPKTTDYPEEYWPDLVDLVGLADQYHFHLTLEFNPQWADYISQDSEKLNEVWGWESEGHEIALHHHGPYHGSWNGYTNQEGFSEDKKYIGTVADMLAKVTALSKTGAILTDAVGGVAACEAMEGNNCPDDVTNTEIEWPEGAIFQTDGDGSATKTAAAKSLAVVQHDGHDVGVVYYQQFATGDKEALMMPDIVDALTGWQDNTVIGIVFHERNYAEKKQTIEKLFKLLNEHKVQVLTPAELFDKEEEK